MTLLPDTPQHHHAHRTAQRALHGGYRPILTATETGQIVICVVYTANQLDALMDVTDAAAGYTASWTNAATPPDPAGRTLIEAHTRLAHP